MKHIEVLKNAFTEVGIGYTVLEKGDYQYLIIGDGHSIHSMQDGRYLELHERPVDLCLRQHKFIEFENGELASYPNF